MKSVATLLVSLGLVGALLPQAWAGGGEELVEAPVYDEVLNQISMREAELLWKAKVPFFDVNTTDVRMKGWIPNSVYFNVRDWKKLLPADKSQTMVFYCANRLCTNSENAAREVMKLGYSDVRQMPDGIQGWALSGRPMETP